MKVKALLGAAIAVISINAFAEDAADTTAAAPDTSAAQPAQPKQMKKHHHKHLMNKKKAKEVTEQASLEKSSASPDASSMTDTTQTS